MTKYLTITEDDKKYSSEILEYELPKEEDREQYYTNKIWRVCSVSVTISTSAPTREFVKKLNAWEKYCFEWNKHVFSHDLDDTSSYRTLYITEVEDGNVIKTYKLTGANIVGFKATKKQVKMNFVVLEAKDVSKEFIIPKRSPRTHKSLESCFVI